MKPTSKHIVGYWHYGVILTYLSLALSICAICFATAYNGPRRGDIAAFFTLLAGLCDAFDGLVARTRKNRTDGDRMFGMQIDSLCDIVSFGIAPIMVAVAMGMTRWYFVFAYVYFALCGLVRLAHYNVLEINKFYNPEAEQKKEFEGMPITTISLSLPVFYLVATMFDNPATSPMSPDAVWIYKCVLMMFLYIVHGTLFIIKFKMPKVGVRGIIITVVTITVLVLALALIRYYVCGVVLFGELKRFDSLVLPVGGITGI